MAQPNAKLSPLPTAGRKFTRTRRVRLGDVTPEGTLRLDALARYAQDISSDDTRDAGLSEETAWVARRLSVEIEQPAALDEMLELTTFCGAIGKRWAERRISVVGEAGARYELATLWIHIDLESGRPLSVTDQFRSIYAEAAGDLVVSARLTLATSTGQGVAREWPTRASDFDPMQHVNNAVYWTGVEDAMLAGGADGLRTSALATIEYRSGIQREDLVRIETLRYDDGLRIWWHVGGTVVASAEMRATG